MSSIAPSSDAAGGTAGGGVAFPLLEGEKLLKIWHAPHSPFCALSRDTVCLVKTAKTVAYEAQRVQPCCPTKIIFASKMQSFEPETIAAVRVSKAPYDMALLNSGIMGILLGVGGIVAGGEVDAIKDIPIGIVILCLGLVQIARFIIKAKNALCEVELTTSIETHSIYGCFKGAEQVFTTITPANIGQLKMGADDDVGKDLLLPANTVETEKGTWTLADPKNPNVSCSFIVTDCRLVYRSFKKVCCMVVEDDMLTINPEQIQSMCLDSAPVSVQTFYGSIIGIFAGLGLLVAGMDQSDAMEQGFFFGGIFLSLVGFVVFLGGFCARPQDVLNIYLKTAVFAPIYGTQNIGPILIPTGDGKAALAAARLTLDVAVAAARKRRRGGDQTV